MSHISFEPTTAFREFIICSLPMQIDFDRDYGPLGAVWPDWAIYYTLGNFLKPLATINLPKSPTFLGNFGKGVKIYHFSYEISFGQLLWTFGDFFWSHSLGVRSGDKNCKTF